VATPTNIGPLLSVTDIARNLDASYERLRGFIEALGTDLGPIKGQGKGFRYTYETQDVLRRLLEAQDRGELTPKTAKAWLAQQNGHGTPESLSRDIVPIAQLPPESGTLKGEEFVTAIVRALAQAAPEDRLLTLKEAHQEYGVSIGALRQMALKEGGRVKVKKSAVLAYIAHL